MDPAARVQANLNVLKRHDKTITEIVDRSSHVVVYQFKEEVQAWTKRNVEGTLFVFKRSIAPFYGFFIMNRLGVENIICFLTDKLDLQITPEYIMYRKDQTLQPDGDQVYGLWLFEDQDRDRLSRKLEMYVGPRPLFSANAGEKGKLLTWTCGSSLRGLSLEPDNDANPHAIQNEKSDISVTTDQNKGNVDVMSLLTKAFTSHGLKNAQEQRDTSEISNHVLSAAAETVYLKPSIPPSLAAKDGQILLSLIRPDRNQCDSNSHENNPTTANKFSDPSFAGDAAINPVNAGRQRASAPEVNHNTPPSDNNVFGQHAPFPAHSDNGPVTDYIDNTYQKPWISSEDPNEFLRYEQQPHEGPPRNGSRMIPQSALMNPPPDRISISSGSIPGNLLPHMMRMPPPHMGMPPAHFMPPPAGLLYPPHAAAATGAAFASRFHGKPGGGPISKDVFVGALFNLMQTDPLFMNFAYQTYLNSPKP